MSMSNVVLCAPMRTAIGTFGGALKNMPASDLGAMVIAACLERAKLAASDVEIVAMGQVVQAGAKMNPARQAAIKAGIPVTVPAMTLNRVCGSGAQAIASAAQEIMLGLVKCAVAGGMENMDQAPYVLTGGRWGYRLGDGQIYDSMLRDGLNDAFSGQHSGSVTEDLVKKLQIPREAQDEWALRSQARFAAGQEAGRFATEIAPIEISNKAGTVPFAKDEHNRPDTSRELLRALKPAFRKDGTITAGNAPGLNSGAAAVILADASWAKEKGLQPLARLVSFGVGAVEPGLFGLGPIPAIKQALSRAELRLADIDRFEINEAFAAVVLALMRELGLPEHIVNVDGGAIAHGHPIGATGAVLAVRLLHAMQRDNLNRGLVSLCIGGGQGVALVLERLR